MKGGLQRIGGPSDRRVAKPRHRAGLLHLIGVLRVSHVAACLHLKCFLPGLKAARAASGLDQRERSLFVEIESVRNQMESQIAHAERPTPREIAANRKAYAFERSLGIPPAEACRRAGGKVENGHATKWERNVRVQAWIGYFRSLGHTDEMLAAKRQRVEDELRLVAHANMADFVSLVPSGASVLPVLDLTRINAMTEPERRAALSAVKTIKYTENGPTFELHGKLDALAQLRDMHGFKAVQKTALTDPTGNNPASVFLIADRPMSEAEWEAQRADQSA